MDLPDFYTGMVPTKMETEGEGIYASTAQFNVRRTENDQGLTLPPKTNSSLQWQPVTDEELEAIIGSLEVEQPTFNSHESQRHRAAFEDAFASPSPPRQMRTSRSPSRSHRQSPMSTCGRTQQATYEQTSEEALISSVQPPRASHSEHELGVYQNAMPILDDAQAVAQSLQYQDFNVPDSVCDGQQDAAFGESRVSGLAEDMGYDFDASGFDFDIAGEQAGCPENDQPCHQSSQAPDRDDTGYRKPSTPKATPTEPDISIPSIEPRNPVEIPYGSTAPLPRDNYTREEMSLWSAWLLKRESEHGVQKSLAREVLQLKLNSYLATKKSEPQNAPTNSIFRKTFNQEPNTTPQSAQPSRRPQQTPQLPASSEPLMKMDSTSQRVLLSSLSDGLKFLLTSICNGKDLQPEHARIVANVNLLLKRAQADPNVAASVAFALLQLLKQNLPKGSGSNGESSINDEQLIHALRKVVFLLKDGNLESVSADVGKLETTDFYEAKLEELKGWIENLKAENACADELFGGDEEVYDSMTAGVSQLASALVTALHALKESSNQYEQEREALQRENKSSAQSLAQANTKLKEYERAIHLLKLEVKQLHAEREQNQQNLQPALLPSTPPSNSEVSFERDSISPPRSNQRAGTPDGNLGWFCGLMEKYGTKQCLKYNDWYSTKVNGKYPVRIRCCHCLRDVPVRLRIIVSRSQFIVNADQQVTGIHPIQVPNPAGFDQRVVNTAARPPSQPAPAFSASYTGMHAANTSISNPTPNSRPARVLNAPHAGMHAAFAATSNRPPPSRTAPVNHAPYASTPAAYMSMTNTPAIQTRPVTASTASTAAAMMSMVNTPALDTSSATTSTASTTEVNTPANTPLFDAPSQDTSVSNDGNGPTSGRKRKSPSHDSIETPSKRMKSKSQEVEESASSKPFKPYSITKECQGVVRASLGKAAWRPWMGVPKPNANNPYAKKPETIDLTGNTEEEETEEARIANEEAEQLAELERDLEVALEEDDF